MAAAGADAEVATADSIECTVVAKGAFGALAETTAVPPAPSVLATAAVAGIRGTIWIQRFSERRDVPRDVV